MNFRLWSRSVTVLISMVGLFGCGDGRVKFNVAQTTGQVMCQGKPVPFVTVYFEPLKVTKDVAVVGKQGIGYADEDGNYAISTYAEKDGAVIGKHRVRVGRPLGEDVRDFKCDCVINEEVNAAEVEVVAGEDNVFKIDLKPLSEASPKEQSLAAKTSADAAQAAAEIAEEDK